MLKNRIIKFANYLGISIRKFEDECNLVRGNIGNMTGALGSDKLSKITDRYPELNMYWLLTGRGEMLRSAESQPDSDLQGKYLELQDKLVQQSKYVVLLEKHLALLEKKML